MFCATVTPCFKSILLSVPVTFPTGILLGLRHLHGIFGQLPQDCTTGSQLLKVLHVVQSCGIQPKILHKSLSTGVVQGKYHMKTECRNYYDYSPYNYQMTRNIPVMG